MVEIGDLILIGNALGVVRSITPPECVCMDGSIKNPNEGELLLKYHAVLEQFERGLKGIAR